MIERDEAIRCVQVYYVIRVANWLQLLQQLVGFSCWLPPIFRGDKVTFNKPIYILFIYIITTDWLTGWLNGDGRLNASWLLDKQASSGSPSLPPSQPMRWDREIPYQGLCLEYISMVYQCIYCFGVSFRDNASDLNCVLYSVHSLSTSLLPPQTDIPDTLVFIITLYTSHPQRKYGCQSVT